MDRIPVTSENLRSIGYDEAARVLEVEFDDGSVYQYPCVPKDVYLGLVTAPSKGSYFHYHVKKAGYDYRRIR
jgi:hypothetical protein